LIDVESEGGREDIFEAKEDCLVVTAAKSDCVVVAGEHVITIDKQWCRSKRVATKLLFFLTSIYC
jgi:hypothetical protein